ncbi:hypothetical protein scyTo_0024064 [Scyliorhinus torazame]|uniref:Uncharacterized protein n=1 Tax=Scyliorhinus torazame TaxID=75743 RepID=A0A401QDC4_SCYTO|nr:hypothetical protein [Scyliorhinus torazame]
MGDRKQPEELIDQFVNMCQDKGKDCDVLVAALSEQIVELGIASMPIKTFQKDLLKKKKGHRISTLLKAGSKKKTIVVGQQHLQA